MSLDPSPDPNGDLVDVVWCKWVRGPIRRYKGRGKGPMKAKRCVCCFPQSVAGEVVPLRHGITVVLCRDHRDPRFIHSRGGRDFLSAFASLFESIGLVSPRYRDAAASLVEQVLLRARPTPRRRPGSYAWPGARYAAEKVWAGDGDYHAGERAALGICTTLPDGVRPPHPQTIRRWWRERRWIIRRPGEEPRPEPRRRVELPDRRAIRYLPPRRPDDPDPSDHWLMTRRRR